MVIGICEDQERDCLRIKEACIKVIKSMTNSIRIETFMDGQEVLDYKEPLDLLFLDIELPRVDGIQVKEQFQRQRRNTMILYVSMHDELMASAFGMHVYGFIRKCTLEQSIQQMLPGAMEILQNYSMIEGNIDSRQVVYIKAERVYCRLFLEDGKELLIRQSLEKLERQLGAVGFVRTHKSYIINLKWVCKLEERGAQTKLGTVPVSIRLKTKTKKAYEEYARKNAGYC